MITCCTRKAEILKAEPGEKISLGIEYQVMAEKFTA
jgi:hypothetical protein